MLHILNKCYINLAQTKHDMRPSKYEKINHRLLAMQCQLKRLDVKQDHCAQAEQRSGMVINQ